MARYQAPGHHGRVAHTPEERDGITLRIVVALGLPLVLVAVSLVVAGMVSTAFGLEYAQGERLRAWVGAVASALALGWTFWRVGR